MRVRLGWLLGELSARVDGAGTEEFLNRCAALGVELWTMKQTERDSLRVRTAGRNGALLQQAADESGCTLRELRRRGLPFFLLGFRRRYALLAGLVLCLGLLAVGSHVVLDVEVTGNEILSDREILALLRLCGVGVGTYGPSVPVRTVENRMLLSTDRLSFCALTFHGTRAVVSVREGDPAPEVKEGDRPADVVADADGVILHMEPWEGDAKFREGDGVLAGEVLITGTMTLDPPPLIEGDLGTMTVRAAGRVMAQTRRTMTARIDLTAAGKVYTGETFTRYSLDLLGRRVNFYENSGIPYAKYDTIIKYKTWEPWGDRGLPVVLAKETVRAYETAPLSLDPDRAETLLRDRLTEALLARLEEGKVLRQTFQTEREGDTLTVTLQAQCTEQIGRTREWGAPGDAAGPRLPDPDTKEQREANDANDRTDSEH